MAAIQLGIGQSITSLVGKPKRDLLLQDFSIVETVQFPRLVTSFHFAFLFCCSVNADEMEQILIFKNFFSVGIHRYT